MSKMKRIYEEHNEKYKNNENDIDIAFMKFCERENERIHEQEMIKLFEKIDKGEN
jgi:hypothetical protein